MAALAADQKTRARVVMQTLDGAVGGAKQSYNMGIPAQFQHPNFLDALQHVVQVCRRFGKLAGIQPGDEKQAEQWISMGYNAISWKTDISVYRATLVNEIGWVRDRLSRK